MWRARGCRGALRRPGALRKSSRLYRRTSGGLAATPADPGTGAPPSHTSSEIVVEPLLGAAEAEHGPERGRLLRRQPHGGRAPLPERALAGEKIVHLVRLVLRNAQAIQRHVQDRFLSRVGIEADGGQQQARAVIGSLGVEQDALVVRAMKVKVAVALQRAVLAPGPVEGGDPVLDVARALEVPRHELVLLGVEVFLLSRQRAVLAQLVAAVDAPGGREGR